jgi:hypothetical protein
MTITNFLFIIAVWFFIQREFDCWQSRRRIDWTKQPITIKGCSIPAFLNWLFKSAMCHQACVLHDEDYSKGGRFYQRWLADLKLLIRQEVSGFKILTKETKTALRRIILAPIMFAGVFFFAQSAYKYGKNNEA